MANRHNVQKRARGGGLPVHGGGAAHGGTTPKHDPIKKAYTGQTSEVEKESRKMKSGGKVHGFKSGGRLDKKARGGSIAKKASGGRVHASHSHKPHTPGVHASGKDMTKSPFSYAHVVPGHADGGNPHPPHHLKHKGPHVAHPKDSHVHHSGHHGKK